MTTTTELSAEALELLQKLANAASVPSKDTGRVYAWIWETALPAGKVTDETRAAVEELNKAGHKVTISAGEWDRIVQLHVPKGKDA